MKFFGIASSVATLAGFAIAASPAKAAVINFESGFVDRQRVNTVTGSDGNQVTFSVGPDVDDRRNARIARRGNLPTAFLPRDGGRTSYRNRIGRFVLTDGILNSLDYYIQFSSPVSRLSLDFLDFGDLIPNSTATLRAYSNSNFTNEIAQARINGTSTLFNSTLNTFALDNLGSAKSFSISYSTDFGTAIDNIYYDTVPEPLTIFGTLVAAGFGVAMKRKRQAG